MTKQESARREIDYGDEGPDVIVPGKERAERVEDTPDIIVPGKEKPEWGEDTPDGEQRPDSADAPVEIGPGLEEIIPEEDKNKIPALSPDEIQKIIDAIDGEDNDAERDAEVERAIAEARRQNK